MRNRTCHRMPQILPLELTRVSGSNGVTVLSGENDMTVLKAILLLMVLALPWSNTANAQSLFSTSEPTATTPVLPDPLTPEAANALMSRLSDAEVRALLLDQLHTQAIETDTANNTNLSDLFYHATTGAANNAIKSIKGLPQLFAGEAKVFSTFYKRIGGGNGLLVMFGYFVLVFGIAALAELGFRRLTKNWRIAPPVDPKDIKLHEILKLLVQRLSTQVVAVVIFIFVARIASSLIVPANIHPIISLIGFYLIGFPRLALAFAFFLFAPMNREYRLLNIETPAARNFCKHQFWITFLLGFSVAMPAFNQMHGIAPGEIRLGFWLNTAMHVYMVCVLWIYRGSVTDMMRGSDPDVSPLEDRVARIYPYFGIAVVIAVWWLVKIIASYGNFELLAKAPHYKTMTLILFAPAMDTLIRGLVRHLSPPMKGEGIVAERAYLAGKRSYIRIGRVLVFGFSVLIIAGFWGLSATHIASAGVGPRLAGSAIEFLFIMSIGYLLYEAVSLYINNKLAAEQTASGFDPDSAEVGGDGGGAGGSRLSTVLPLILGVCRSIIVVVFLLLGLGQAGVDTTPLLAGAGIVGLAIGFGAQKLVTDVVSGIFFLIDDAFRTGEYVTIDQTMGTVEKISIRSLQLRHHKGPVHTIPFGEIPKITNYSRDWVIMKLRFTVPFGTDPNKVKKIFKKIGQEMLEIPEFADDFIQPFKSQGMLEIDDIGMVFRGKFMAKPGTQFTIRKEIFNRVNAAFEENGLEFARREVRVALPSMEGTKLTQEDKAAISAAATQAAQDTLPEDKAAKDNQQ